MIYENKHSTISTHSKIEIKTCLALNINRTLIKKEVKTTYQQIEKFEKYWKF